MKTLKYITISFLIILGFITPIQAAEHSLDDPNIIVDVEGNDTVSYITILCDNKDTHYDVYQYPYEDEINDFIHEKFNSYDAPDHFYYRNTFSKLSNEDNQLQWDGKSETFYILIYVPENDSFYLSNQLNASTYLTKVHLTLHPENGTVETSYSNSFGLRILSFMICALLPVLLKVGIGWLFGYHNSHDFKKLIQHVCFLHILASLLIHLIQLFTGYFVPFIVLFIFSIFSLILDYSLFKTRMKTVSYPFMYSLISNSLSICTVFYLMEKITYLLIYS